MLYQLEWLKNLFPVLTVVFAPVDNFGLNFKKLRRKTNSSCLKTTHIFLDALAFVPFRSLFTDVEMHKNLH